MHKTSGVESLKGRDYSET